MPVSDEFMEFVVEQLEGVGEIRSKRMFGGAGLYADGTFFALIENDTLRMKVDDSNREMYEAAGSKPFKPYEDKPTLMQYYEVPIDVLEDREVLKEWAAKSVDVARKAEKKRKNKRK